MGDGIGPVGDTGEPDTADPDAVRGVAPATTARRPARWRGWAVGVLVFLVALAAPLAVAAHWTHSTIGDTGTYVRTVAPLAADPAVQDAVVARLTSEVVSAVDVRALSQNAVDALAGQGLPPLAGAALGALTSPLADGVESFIEKQVRRLVTSDQFAQAWDAANRQAHTRVVAVLSGAGTTLLGVSGDTISINLAQVIEQAKSRLVASGFTLAARIPQIDVSFTLVESAAIPRAQRAYAMLDSASTWLPVLGVLLLVGAVAIARERRRTVVAGGAAVVAGMLLLGGALNVVRPLYLDSVPSDVLPRDAAAAVFDTLTDPLRTSLRAVALVALVVALVAWVAGRFGTGAALRERLSVTGRSARSRTRRPFRLAVLGAAAVVYVLADHPTAPWTAGLVGAAVLVLVLGESFAAPPDDQPSTPG